MAMSIAKKAELVREKKLGLKKKGKPASGKR